MSKSEYQDLVEFLEVRFTKIDERFLGIDEHFLGIDARFLGIEREHRELVEFLGVQFTKIGERFTGVETRLTRVEVLHEETRHMVQTVAEGVVMGNQKVDRLEERMDSRFNDFQAVVQLSHRDLDRRVTRLEQEREPSR